MLRIILGIAFISLEGMAASRLVTREIFPMGAASKWEMSVSSGGGWLAGTPGWGLEAQILRGDGIPNPFSMGLTIGLHRWERQGVDPFKSFSFVPQTTTTSVISLLPTFRWEMFSRGKVIPFLGIALGPAVIAVDGDAANGAQEQLWTVGAAAQLRPGLLVQIGSSARVSLEGSMGWLKGKMTGLVHMGLSWFL